MGTDYCSITPVTHQVPELVSRKSRSENTIVKVNGIPIGGREVHYRPEEALCDGSQSLYPDDFGMLVQDTCKVAEAIGRSVYKLKK